MRNMQVRDMMTKHPALIDPDMTLEEAAATMREIDCGFPPAGALDSLDGTITDCDIILRALAHNKNPGVSKKFDSRLTPSSLWADREMKAARDPASQGGHS